MGICVSCRRRDRKVPEKRSGVGLGAGGPAKGPAAAELLPRRVDHLPAMANSISNIKMTNPIKGIVSKRRKRYIKDGFNLDLAYITDRLIAMGFPAEKLEGVYRNHIDEVYRFLEQMHKDHYKIYNLCSERSYDISRFQGRVERYAFEDHTPPNMELIQPFCEDVDKWLRADPRNVAAVHCKAGKGRTGTMVCCYLLYSGQKATADEALQFYGSKRAHDEKGVTIPSQRRYVEYYAALVRSRLQYAHTAVYIRELVMCPPPMLNGGQCTLELTVSQAQPPFKAPHGCHEVRKHASSVRVCLTHCTPLTGDVRVDVYNKPKMMMRKEKLFHFWFNTFFLVCEVGAQRIPSPADSPNQETYKLTLNKWQLDDAHKDKQHKLYSPEFKVELIVQKQPDTSTFSSHPLRPPSPAGSSSASDCSSPAAHADEHWDSGEHADHSSAHPAGPLSAAACRAHPAGVLSAAANYHVHPSEGADNCVVHPNVFSTANCNVHPCGSEERDGDRPPRCVACSRTVGVGDEGIRNVPRSHANPASAVCSEEENFGSGALSGPRYEAVRCTCVASSAHSSIGNSKCKTYATVTSNTTDDAVYSCKHNVDCDVRQISDNTPSCKTSEILVPPDYNQVGNNRPDKRSKCKHCDANPQTCHKHTKDGRVEASKSRPKQKHKSSKYTIFDNPANSSQYCSAADSDDASTQCSYKQDCKIRFVAADQPYKELVYQRTDPIVYRHETKSDPIQCKQNCNIARSDQVLEPECQFSDLASAQSSRTQSPLDSNMETDRAQSPEDEKMITEPSFKKDIHPDFFQGTAYADNQPFRSTIFQTDLTLDQNYIRLDDPTSNKPHWGPDFKDRDYSEDHMFFDFSGNRSKLSNEPNQTEVESFLTEKPSKLKYTSETNKHSKSSKSKFDKIYRTYPEQSDPNVDITDPKFQSMCPPDMFLKADKTFSPNFKTDSKNYIKFTCMPPNTTGSECYKPSDPYSLMPDVESDQAYPNLAVAQDFPKQEYEQDQCMSRSLIEPCCKSDKATIKPNFNLLPPPEQSDNRAMSKPRLSLTDVKASWKEFSGKFSDNRKKRDKD